VADLPGPLREVRRVALDTMVFIYAFEGHPEWGPLVKPVFQAVEKGSLEATTSTISLVECLTKPLREGRHEVAALYEALFGSFPNLEVRPIGIGVARTAARIRARHGMPTPDALQTAAALEAGADCLLTHDLGLPEIEGLRLMQVKDLKS
jgi:predicted nucleic acid-binding protein